MVINGSKTLGAFLLLAPFPTRKAYGVTTKYTLESLSKADYEIDLIKLSPDLIHRLKKLYIPEIALFAIYRLVKLLSFLNSSIFKHYRFVWTRSPSAMLSLLWNRDLMCVVEIHKDWNKVLYRLINAIPTKRLLLLPVSNLLLKSAVELMPLKNGRILYSPMAAPQSYIEFGRNYKYSPPSVCKFITLCYVGRFRSSGKLQGVEELIKCLNQVDSRYKFKLRLIGIGYEGQDIIHHMFERQLILPHLLVETFLDVDHKEIPYLTSDVDIFLLPYPEGRYFAGRFPIKAVEYMSLKRPIFATNTLSHNAILAQDKAFFFDFNSVDSLSHALDRYSKASHSNLTEMINFNFDFALENSYEKRTERVLRLLS